MSLAEFSTRRRVTVAMVTVTLVLFGLIALRDLKVNLLPDLSYPTLTVRTEYVGAAPAEIENLVTEPIEESVGVVKNLRKLHSVSRTGQSDVILEFAWGTNMDKASIEVREIPGRSGAYSCKLFLRPHFQLDDIVSGFHLVTQLSPPTVAA